MIYGHLKAGYGNVHKDILSNKNLDAYSIKVYAILSAYQGGSSYCFPSIDYISKNYNMDRKTVMSRIKVLEDEKIITKQKTKTGNRYYVMQPVLTKNEIEAVKPENQQVPSGGTTQVPSHGTTQVPSGGTLRITNKINIKNNIEELKAYSKAKGGLMIIHKNRIEEMLKDFTVEQLKRAIDSGTKWAEKNEVGRKNLSRSIVEHSIKNSKPKVAKYMTSDEYKKKFPGKVPVKTDKELWF